MRSFAFCSWAFVYVIDFAATDFVVLMVNEGIYKVLDPAFKIHNHKIKLFLNLRKIQI